MKNIGCVVVLVVLGVVVLLGGWLVSLNNRLVALQESTSAAWAQVETVLQRRYDLIPNLVNTVKGYAEHEKGLFEEVTKLRSQWASARTVGEKVEAAGQLEGSLARLLEDLGPGGGYVLCAVHNVQPEVPTENIVAMYDAAYESGF